MKDRYLCLLGALLLALSRAALCSNVIHSEYAIKFESRYGYHFKNPADFASHRQVLEANGKVKYGAHLAASLGARGFVEGALAANENRYANAPAIHKDTQELIPRDLYVEYKDSLLGIRLGNQQVVWGETFGFHFADLVNPKDFREAGTGELETNRLPSPILNVRLTAKDYSAQFLYVVKPYFHKLPHSGNDFFHLSPLFPNQTVTIHDERTLPLNLRNSEVGGRLTGIFEGVDLSLFGLYYFDRMPNYTIQSTTPEVTLTASHRRLYTLGTTATYDFSIFLLRAEVLVTKGRSYDVLDAGNFKQEISDEFTGVLEMDFKGIEGWHLGAQIAQVHLTRNIEPVLGRQDITLLSAHLAGSIWRDQNIDLILSYLPNDGSTLTRLQYLVPLSNTLELILGSDYFTGNPRSQFGRFNSASRGYLLLKAYLQG